MGPRLPFAELLELSSLTLATASLGGEPHAATVYFVCDDRLIFYFLSAPNSQHSCDLAANPCAALTLDLPAPRWQDIRGLQVRGKVREVTSGAQQAAAWVRFLVKFPNVRDLETEVLKNRWYAFSPEWVRWIDNHIRFGHKQEWAGDGLLSLTGEQRLP
jgi:uncharacterized protein YhbP (UPF0306 family)